MIQTLLHRLLHFFDKETETTRKHLFTREIYAWGKVMMPARFYSFCVNKRGNACCPVCLTELDIGWKMSNKWINNTLIVRVIYYPDVESATEEYQIYCKECPDTIKCLNAKRW